MKLTELSALSTLALLAGLVGCSGDDTEPTDNSGGTGGTGQAGKGGTGGTGQAGKGGTGGTGTAGTGTGGTNTAGTGGTNTAGTGGTGTAGSGTAGSASGGGGTGGGASDSPSDVTQAGIEAFLAANEYRDAGWVADVSAPREQTSPPHGRVQIWFNGTVRRGKDMAPRPSGSMIVKELYDAGTNVVGHAVMLRSSATTNQWIYYCVANADARCSSSSMANTPSYSVGTGACMCHGSGTVITPIPPP